MSGHRETVRWWKARPGDQELLDKTGRPLKLLRTTSKRSFQTYPGIDPDDYVLRDGWEFTYNPQLMEAHRAKA